MLRNKIYYRLKPLLPDGLRMALRRQHAKEVRRNSSAVWPILPGSERPPENWPGWPDGKKFAVVLTHDVETAEGMEKCRKLMDLERECGFVSSFNFIPEGGYRTPPELRRELLQNGFEVGVHDLKHDGRLFDSRIGFRKHAARINHYLTEWGAAGFRSGFMLHELDWLHDLDIKYDLSTFDTDPFEPQPEGRSTIYPFWVPRASDPGKGYIEMPYTLPQDSTLFLVLREATPEIWLRKLDWIAEHGGMALLNVHPDYVRFEGDPESGHTFPVAHYRRFLEYVRDKYQPAYWQALPGQVAKYLVNSDQRPVTRTRLRVGMVTHSYYQSDNRVIRYAEALAARGDHVEVLALRNSPDANKEDVIGGVHVSCIQDRFTKAERTRAAYLWPWLRFLCVASWNLARRHCRQKYDVLHIHNMPDFVVFSALLPKLFGARVILDIHDVVPEFYASKFHRPERGLLFTLLSWMERASAAVADQVIIANDLWLEKYAKRTHTAGRCTAFINNVNAGLFRPRQKARQDDRLIILFPGGLAWHQGVDIAIRAFKIVSAELPRAEFHIYGDGIARESLIALAGELGLADKVRFFKILTVREIAAVMADADLGVVPKRADSFGNEAYSTKIMEFMAVGVPVVVSSTKVDRFYFDDSVVRFFESGDVDALAREMLSLLGDPVERAAQAARALDYARRNSWETRKGDYLKLVDSLCASSELDPSETSARSSSPTRLNQASSAASPAVESRP